MYGCRPVFRFISVSIVGGVTFGVLDGLLNANPLAQHLYAFYKPVARPSVNVAAGIAIDLGYGFATAGVFLLLYKSLPGEAGWMKGLSYGLLVWFFRVVMGAAGQWVMFVVPPVTLVYSLAAGLLEMLVLGLFYGLALKPPT
jgi:hypothetical protein